jgi:hypothetical protein
VDTKLHKHQPIEFHGNIEIKYHENLLLSLEPYTNTSVTDGFEESPSFQIEQARKR